MDFQSLSLKWLKPAPSPTKGRPFSGLWLRPDGLCPLGAWNEFSLLAFVTHQVLPTFSCQPYWPQWKESLLYSPCDTARAPVINLAMVPKDGSFQASTEGQEWGVGTVEELTDKPSGRCPGLPAPWPHCNQKDVPSSHWVTMVPCLKPSSGFLMPENGIQMLMCLQGPVLPERQAARGC